jgi:separase
MLQSLRLWNRAIDTLSRLNPPPAPSKPVSDPSDPFDMSSMSGALPSNTLGMQSDVPVPRKTFSRKPSMDSLEWRAAEGLLLSLFTLSHTYFVRGSPREAEYFAQQAQELAESLNAPVMASRALTKKAEILLHRGQLKEGYENLERAAEFLDGVPGTEAAEIHRLQGEYQLRNAKHLEAQQLFQSATTILEQMDKMFFTLDSVTSRYVQHQIPEY